jgi:hypothetical protein
LEDVGTAKGSQVPDASTGKYTFSLPGKRTFGVGRLGKKFTEVLDLGLELFFQPPA